MKYGLQYFTDTHLTLVGLLVFFVWFVGMCFFVYRKLSPQYHDHMSQLPLTKEGRFHEQ